MPEDGERNGTRTWPCYIVVFLALVLSLASVLNISNDTVREPMTPEELAVIYAPRLVFDTDEYLRPMSPEVFLNSSSLKLHTEGGEVSISDDALSLLASSAELGPYHYLDSRYGGLDDDGVIEAFTEEGAGNITAFVHVERDGGLYLVQYWFFYAFNYGPLNRHEGDWEMFQVVLDEAQRPLYAMVSQHGSGERMAWDDLQAPDGHVPIFVALGSHANYFAPLSDDPDEHAFQPERVSLVMMNGTATPWMLFQGKWGEWGGEYGQLLGRRGPNGPMFRQGGGMWDGIGWGDSLSTASSGWSNDTTDLPPLSVELKG